MKTGKEKLRLKPKKGCMSDIYLDIYPFLDFHIWKEEES